MEEYFVERYVGVNDSYIPFLDDYLKPVLDLFYPDRYYLDFGSITYEDTEGREVKETDKTVFIVVIHFPEIDLYNSLSDDKIHVIRDLYVRLTFNDEGESISQNISGARGTYTLPEARVGYKHSHLSGSSVSNLGKWATFCLGSGHLRSMCGTYNMAVHKSYSVLKNFFLQLNSYVAWESLEGKPHIYSNRIVSSSKIPFHPSLASLESHVSHFKDTVYEFLKEHFSDPLLFQEESFEIRISKDKIIILNTPSTYVMFLIYSLWLEANQERGLRQQILKFYCYELGGQYFSEPLNISSDQIQQISSFFSEDKYLELTSHQRVLVQLYPTEEDMQTYNSVFHPIIVELFRSHVEDIFNKNFKKLLYAHKSIDYRKLQEGVQLPVQSDL